MLEVTDLHAGYGKVPVLNGLDFKAPAGAITLVLGPNGAGKSTLLKALAGFIKPSRGSVTLEDAPVTGGAPEDLVASGMRLVLDNHRVFPRLSVRDNIRLGTTFLKDRTGIEDRIAEVFEVFPILKERYLQRASSLSGGQQQMLALAQAFVAKPKVLLCDEPSLGLATALMPAILEFLRTWSRSGVAVVLVEQQIDVSLRYADNVAVMVGGRLQTKPAAAVAGSQWIRDAYFGN
ncbi:ABC transporter ATP-binding protein [soil metagenome]